MPSKRVGIFGGTFDPPHLGHLILAETIREDFGLDEVLFVPCNEPPHKSRPGLAPAEHRYAMVVAATLQNPAFRPSALEVNRPGKSYSIDTVRMLTGELGEAELFFVTGLDSFLEIRSWKSWEELLGGCNFVVVSRPHNSFDEIDERLPEGFRERVVDVRRSAAATDGESPPAAGVTGSAADADDPGPRIFLSDAVNCEISSTEIRERVRHGRSVRYRVQAEVERYIATHELYSGAAVSEVVG